MINTTLPLAQSIGCLKNVTLVRLMATNGALVSQAWLMLNGEGIVQHRNGLTDLALDRRCI